MGARAQVLVGGAVGATARWALLVAVAAGGGQLGAEIVAVAALNVVGTAFLAVVVVRARHDARWRDRLPLLGTGLAGAATTFSTLAAQIATLVDLGQGAAAAGLALGAPLAGVVVARSILGRDPLRATGAGRPDAA